MLAVTGANLFFQWFLSDEILNRFTVIPRKLNHYSGLDTARIICIAWSYVILQINDALLISGAWQGQEGQMIPFPLPNDCSKNPMHLLLSCTDYNVVIVDMYNNCIWVLDLETKKFRTVHIVENPGLKNMTDELQDNNEIVKVKATNNTCVYLTRGGIVFEGLLPNYVDTNHCLGKVCDVQCGYEHFLLLTDLGRVYTWGNGRRLQLGHGDINNIEIPTEVEALAGITITKISASGWHSLALSESGDVYAWGWNDTGQLGIASIYHDDSMEDSHNNFGIPTLISIYDENGKEVELNAKDIACGTRHSVVLLDDNSLWTTGCNKYGQLGFPCNQYEKIDSFKRCFSAAKNAKLLCGPWCTVVDY